MKTNIFKYIFFTVLLILLIMAIYTLYKNKTNENEGSRNNEIKINMGRELNMGITEYDTINPVFSNNRDIQYLDKLIFDSLLEITYNFKIQNSLADEFSKINDIMYIVKLKENVLWHDGTKFTAKDVLFTIEGLKNDNINSIYKDNVKDIKSIEQIDDYTIKIILKHEVPFFEYMMCFPILASHSYDEKSLNSLIAIPIGTGKYKITKMDEGNIKLERVDYKNSPKISTINVIIKKSLKDLYNGFTNNEIDFILTDNIKYEEYIGTMGYNINCSPNREFEYLIFNTKNSLLSDNKIRQAISYAINRQNINYNIYNNKYFVTDFVLNYGSYFSNQDKLFEYDINKSREILLENGWIYRNKKWEKGNKILEFDLSVRQENEKRVLVAEEIKKQLETIGIIVNVVKVNSNIYNNYIESKNYDMILNGIILSNTPNLETFFGENNMSNFDNEEMKNLLRDVKNINDIELLRNKYIKIKQIYKEEIPFISLYYNSLFVLANTNLKGDLSHNWFNIYYNIDNWYKLIE